MTSAGSPDCANVSTVSARYDAATLAARFCCAGKSERTRSTDSMRTISSDSRSIYAIFTFANGSSDAPNRVRIDRAPYAYPFTFPCSGVRNTTSLSRSRAGKVCRTMASVRWSRIAGESTLDGSCRCGGTFGGSMRYRVVLHESEEGFSVACPGLPGCWSQGATEAEALDNLRSAIEEYLEAVATLTVGADVREVEVAVS